MKKQIPPFKVFVVLLLSVVIVAFLLFYDFGKSHSRIFDMVINFGHLPLFGMIALITLWIIGNGKWPYKEISYVKAWAITSFLGALTECIQAFIPYRHFRIVDILTDALGSALFLTLTYTVQKVENKKGAILLLKVLLVLMIIRAYPIFEATLDTWNMEKDFPLLSSFESPFEMTRWTNGESRIIRTTAHATNREHSLKVNLLPGIYPGIVLNYLINDWRGYNRLTFDAFVEGSSSLDITVRINDLKHNEEYTDRYNEGFQLQPGDNHISINLDEVKKPPHGRTMDMADITNICIFAYNLKTPRTVYFDNFRLENRS